MKPVMLYDYDYNGLYVGESLSDVCQITGEPLMRIGSTDVKPPECNLPSLLIWDGEKWGVFTPIIEEKPEDLINSQYIGIDQHIQSKIKTRDFDDIGQIALCCVDGNGYQVEALAVSAWVRKCWHIQEQIKLGELVFDSVEAAINELPPFDIAH